jgi:hypothetical protein
MTGGRPPVAPLSSELRHCTAYPDITDGRDPVIVQKPLGLNPWVREELS